ncbi:MULTISPECIES: YqaE/Pmp3 family membrane protein [Acinetobacter]|uniref:YqaE/Pmp3 family membrane protein n=1 Tax=Acinetobacter chengduensis TaxID=2420890 RepID=A0ABX9TRP2_9GAMM|nr:MULTISPECIES: YqaE/Pmp3 family membrane protein [Acinetobacter]MBI1453648.1 YqaE/Pmp3 family membrane protein [Acinetobacter sp. FL51]RLL17016.1 YqaE/Pmp3 family membrane protein [Acinetobacter chengduensis]
MANKCISCNNCGHTGWSKNRGNFLITIVLAIFFFIPAVIYEIWRRTGLGVCENCGSDLVQPSNSCTSNRPSDAGDFIVLGVLGFIGSIVVVVIYAFFNTLINGGPSTQKTTKDYELICMTQGLKHYQQQGQYPMLPNGVETSTHVMGVCKKSKDGKFKAP